jgi:formylglycine-generating enzyme required for sulfatase activity
MQFIQVPTCSVELPASRKVKVRSFAIGTRPITAAEYALFAKHTGYVTSAETNKAEFTVYSNPSLEGAPLADWHIMPALCVGQREALAFCNFYQIQLPTPEQWLAFVRHVITCGLFAIRAETSKSHPALPATHFSTREWLASPKRACKPFLGCPPKMLIPGFKSQQRPPDRTVVLGADFNGDLSITFRGVVHA